MASGVLTQGELLQLKRWNTPSVYNGWEAITEHDRLGGYFNLEPTIDYMPQLGSMVGYAVTVVIQPSNRDFRESNPDAKSAYSEYVSSVPGPKIVVVQDLDKPNYVGAFWGEVNASSHLALGCEGTITDGAIRDLDEMAALGFKAIAARTCVGHAYSTPIRWGCEIEVFGCTVKPGQLIHADKHGFLAIPGGDEQGLLAATRLLDENECNTVLAAALASGEPNWKDAVRVMCDARRAFKQAKNKHF